MDMECYVLCLKKTACKICPLWGLKSIRKSVPTQEESLVTDDGEFLQLVWTNAVIAVYYKFSGWEFWAVFSSSGWRAGFV